jgi:hypothetical protein
MAGKRRRQSTLSTPVTAGLGSAVVVLVACAWMLGLFKSSGTTTTELPTATPQWVTFWSQSGMGNGSTDPFHVPSEWRLKWACDLNSTQREPYELWVELDLYQPATPDALPYNRIEVLRCEPGSTGGTYAEYTSLFGFKNDPATIQVVVANSPYVKPPGSWTFTAQALQS